MKLALATLLVFLAVAPAAQAGWMTGNGNPPIYSTDAPCRNGMGWSYATFIPGIAAPAAPSLDIHAHWVVIDAGPQLDPPDPALRVAFSPTVTIPRRSLLLPPSFTMIGAGLYPGVVNHFDYSRDITINFNRTLLVGTPLRVQWHDWNNALIFGAYRYRVANCYLGTIRSRYELAVHLASAELIAQLKPRRVFYEGETAILVLDQPLKGEVGDRVRLEHVK